MEKESEADELFTLLPSNFNWGHKKGLRRAKRPSPFALSNSSSSKFSIRREPIRPKSQLMSRAKSANEGLVFSSPRFILPSRTPPPSQLDETASDQDEPTTSTVTDSFNPYTSWESGSYTCNQVGSDDANVNEMVSLVNRLNVEEQKDDYMPYIS